MHEVHRARERRDGAVALLGLEASGDARHLPADDALETQLSFAAVGLAREEIANGAGKGLVAHLGAGDRRALRVVHGLTIATAPRTARSGRDGQGNEHETRGASHG